MSSSSSTDSDALSAAAASSAVTSVREVYAKLHSLPPSIPTLSRAAVIGKATERLLQSNYTQHNVLAILVDRLCALAEEWTLHTAAQGSDRELSRLCAIFLLNRISHSALTSATVRSGFVTYYSLEHMRDLLPQPPQHQHAHSALAIQLLSQVLQLIRPLLSVAELLHRTNILMNNLKYLVAADVPPRALLPHSDVQGSLALLWKSHPACIPNESARFDLAVRWIALLPDSITAGSVQTTTKQR